MIWIIISATAAALLSVWLGYKRLVHIHTLTVKKLLGFGVVLMAVFLVLQVLHENGLFPEAVAGASMAGMYASVAGFFLGGAIANYSLKLEAGTVEYVHRTFWIETLPLLLAIGVILFGVKRINLFSELPVTPIRLTSGLSLVFVGIWGWTIRVVPEFRSKGIIILDRFVDWKNFISYRWHTEESLEIEYEFEEKIHLFVTKIPLEDQVEVEQLLKEKMLSKLEEDEEKS